jgi:OFA family oxalate/formate antiporter-like MFS transporter
MSPSDSASTSGDPLKNRWLQLGAGVVSMVMISGLQNGWTLFVQPLDEKYEWGRAAIQLDFTIFILAGTLLVPFEGWLVDRFGPRPVALLGGALVAASWTLNSVAGSLALLYLAAVLGGIGVGCVYGTCLGNALKWFPDRRGLAVGLTIAGYGIGSAFTVIPLRHTIERDGYEAAFLWFGLGQGAVIILAALLLARPVGVRLPPPRVAPTGRDQTPGEVLRSPLFWVLFVMALLITAVPLIFTAYLATIAVDFRVADAPASLLGVSLPALTFALAVDRITNGLARPLGGWLSDHAGRENTMLMAFGLSAIGIFAFAAWGRDPVMFVLLSGVMFFAWGGVASLFPAACTDYFGATYATTNAGMLHIAKGVGAMLVPLSEPIAAAGGWQAVFAVAIAMSLVPAMLGVAVLRPLRAARLKSVAVAR